MTLKVKKMSEEMLVMAGDGSCTMEPKYNVTCIARTMCRDKASKSGLAIT